MRPVVILEQRTSYPWDGTVDIVVHSEAPVTFALALRLPGWARESPVPSDLYRYRRSAASPIRIELDGEPVTVPDEDGYACLTREWRGGETVRLVLPMEPRLVVSHPAVTENAGRVAVERGPLVYCAEEADNDPRVLEDVADARAELRVERRPGMLGGIDIVRYGDKTLIPYYAWSHRGVGAMRVWLERVGAGSASAAG